MLAGRMFPIVVAATANAQDAVTVLVLGCCSKCLSEEQTGCISAESCKTSAR